MASMDKLRKLAKAYREAGDVKRMHVCPVVTDPSVARHSWNMAMLLWLLHPEPSGALMLRVLTHDNAERWTGDTPAPAKYRIHPPLGRELKIVERRIEESLHIDFELNEDEQIWARALDLLEFLMFCEDELAMGNRNVETSLQNVKGHILESTWIPAPVAEFARGYVWERTCDMVEGEMFGALADHS